MVTGAFSLRNLGRGRALVYTALAVGTGQAPVKRYDEFLRDLIFDGRATPSAVVTQRPPSPDASDAYEHFDKREPGSTKVVLKPDKAG